MVTSHSTRALIPQWLAAAHEVGGKPRLLQLPFFRLYAAGPAILPLFFILAGYVCAMKPIRLANAGLPDDARKHIASSGLRRVIRIGVPAAFGTVIAWAVTEAHLFTFVPYVELPGMWLAWGTPKPSGGFIAAVKNLFKACVCFSLCVSDLDSLRHGRWPTTTTSPINGVWRGN